jgi:hypothetical protein
MACRAAQAPANEIMGRPLTNLSQEFDRDEKLSANEREIPPRVDESALKERETNLEIVDIS